MLDSTIVFELAEEVIALLGDDGYQDLDEVIEKEVLWIKKGIIEKAVASTYHNLLDMKKICLSPKKYNVIDISGCIHEVSIKLQTLK